MNRWASVGTPDGGNKSPGPKGNVRFYTEEDDSAPETPDTANLNTSMHKERPKTPEVKPLMVFVGLKSTLFIIFKTPEKKNRESVRTMSESRLPGSDKKTPL